MIASDQAPLLSTNGTNVGLEKVTRRDLHDGGIVPDQYRVYRAAPGNLFEEVNSTEDQDLPLYQGGQTFM
jgi:hypothetical protein